MKTEEIKKLINNYCKENRLNTNAFSKRCGVAFICIKKILDGRTKNPIHATITKILNVVNAPKDQKSTIQPSLMVEMPNANIAKDSFVKQITNALVDPQAFENISEKRKILINDFLIWKDLVDKLNEDEKNILDRLIANFIKNKE